MIENHGRKRRLLCNDCETTFDQVAAEDFAMMIAAARDDGWAIRKAANGEFEHRCPDCHNDDQDGGAVAVQRRLLGF